MRQCSIPTWLGLGLLVLGCGGAARVTLNTAAIYPLLEPVSACRLSEGVYEPERGHVVVIRLDGVRIRTRTVRRIVGLAGDRIAVSNGVLHVGGKPRLTSVTKKRVMCLAGVYPRCRCRITKERISDRTYPVQSLLPENETADARCIPRADYPESTVPAGRVFLLADNRDGATDSRTLGPLPVGRIEARVLGCRPGRREPEKALTPGQLREIERQLRPPER